MAILLPSATFLHIPKCGGSWVVHALAAAGLPLQEKPLGCRHAIAETAGRFVFTFVRHPLTWYPSFWNYRCQEAERQGKTFAQGLQGLARRADMAIDACLVDEHGRPRTFAAFVERCVTEHAGFLSRQYALYTAEAEFVGRQETLCGDLLTALGLAGVAFDAAAIRRLPKVNEADPKFHTVYPLLLAGHLVAAEATAIEAFYANTPRPQARATNRLPYQEQRGRAVATRA